MNTVRRGLLLVPLTVAVILGASVPAWAAFSDPVTASPAIGTIAVTAPSTVGYQPRLSVSTLTSYGWTAESARTGVISC
jgi:hypothetical protein